MYVFASYNIFVSKLRQVTVILYCFSWLVYDLYQQPFPSAIQIHKQSDITLLVQCIAVNTNLSVTMSKGVVLYWI